MREIIISDTSCFIVLSKIGELDLLHKLYGNIVTTPQIAAEFGENLPDWVKIVDVSDQRKLQLLEMQVDNGEASAIAPAIEKIESLLILDDNKARRLAAQLSLNYTGTLGIVISAKQKGIIESAGHLINKIKQTNFRISPELELKALLEAGE
jgi:predicted nucleic acid-binding protein